MHDLTEAEMKATVNSGYHTSIVAAMTHWFSGFRVNGLLVANISRRCLR